MKSSFRTATRIILVTILLALIVPVGSVFAAPAAQQVRFVAPVMVVNSSFLNVRTGPGVQYSVLITVVGGTELPVLGRANDNVWFQVSTVVGVGWVNSQFAIPRGDFSNVPQVDFNFAAAVASAPGTAASVGLPDGQGGGGSAPAAAPGGVGGTFVAGTASDGSPIVISGPNERFRAVINVEAVNLRSQPADSSAALTTLFRNDLTDYPIVGASKDRNGVEWFAIIVPNFGTGWVEAPKLKLRLSGAFRTVVIVVADTVGMGDGPGTGSTRLPTLTAGQEGYLVNISQDGNFVQIELGGGEVGWVPFNSVQTRQGTPTDGLNLTPQQVSSGTPGSGVVVAPSGPRLSTPRLIINTAFLNVRSGPGAQFAPTATLAGGMELPVVGRTPDGVWLLVQGSFGQGWVNQDFTIFRGVYANVPVIPYTSTVGTLSVPTAVISDSLTLYVAPGTNFGVAGTIAGPAELPIVARTADSTWIQVNTTIGYGWVLTSQVLLRGDTSLIPVVG